MSNIVWEKNTEEKFKAMLEKIPIFMRPIAQEKVTKKAESIARGANRAAVNEKDMVDAFFSEQSSLDAVRTIGCVPLAVLQCFMFGTKQSKPTDNQTPILHRPIKYTAMGTMISYSNIIVATLSTITLVCLFASIVIGGLSINTRTARRLPLSAYVAPPTIGFAALFAMTALIFYNGPSYDLLRISRVASHTANIKAHRLQSNFNYLDNAMKNVQRLVPGEYGVNPFNPFQNVWTDKSISDVGMLLSELNRASNACGVHTLLAYGTLLGWARHNKAIIPWDDDIDVMVPRARLQDVIRELRNRSNDTKIHVSPCRSFYKISLAGNPKIPGSDWSWPFIDIFWYDVVGDTIIIEGSTKNSKTSDMSNMSDTTTGVIPTYIIKVDTPIIDNKGAIVPLDTAVATTFVGQPAFIPAYYKELLRFSYGNDWETRCVSSDYCYRTEEIINPKYMQDVHCSDLVM